MEIFPNPVNDLLVIKGTGSANQKYQALITDNNGKKLLVQTVSFINNLFNFSIPVRGLQAGNHYCTITNETGQVVATKKILK